MPKNEQPNPQMMTSWNQSRNAEKIARQEAELEELLKKTRGGGTPNPEPEGDPELESDRDEEEGQNEPPEQDEEESNVGRSDDDNSDPPEGEDDDTDKTADQTNWKKRYSDLRSHASKKEAELQKEIDNLKAGHEPPQDEKALKAWMEKNPNAAKIIKAIAREQAREMVDGIDDKFKQLEDEKKAITRQKAEAELKKAHPDFEEIAESDKFRDWLDQQSAVMQSAMYDNAEDWKAASAVLKLYKAEHNLSTKRGNRNVPDAAKDVNKNTSTPNPSARGKKIWTESEVAAMNVKDFEANLADIELARREGRFKYDRSAAMR